MKPLSLGGTDGTRQPFRQPLRRGRPLSFRSKWATYLNETIDMVDVVMMVFASFPSPKQKQMKSRTLGQHGPGHVGHSKGVWARSSFFLTTLIILTNPRLRPKTETFSGLPSCACACSSACEASKPGIRLAISCTVCWYHSSACVGARWLRLRMARSPERGNGVGRDVPKSIPSFACRSGNGVEREAPGLHRKGRL